MLPGKAKENKMKNQKTITKHTRTHVDDGSGDLHVLRWFLLQLLLLTFMAEIADILLFIYTARIKYGTVTNTHTHARVHQNQHPNVI